MSAVISRRPSGTGALRRVPVAEHCRLGCGEYPLSPVRWPQYSGPRLPGDRLRVFPRTTTSRFPQNSRPVPELEPVVAAPDTQYQTTRLGEALRTRAITIGATVVAGQVVRLTSVSFATNAGCLQAMRQSVHRMILDGQRCAPYSLVTTDR